MNHVLVLSTVIIEVFYAGVYLKGLFRQYERKGFAVIVSYIAAGVFLFSINLFSIAALNFACSLVYILLLAKILFGVRWLHAVLSALSLCLIYGASEVACIAILLLFGADIGSLGHFTSERVFLIVLTKLVATFCILFIIKLSQWRRSGESLFSAVPLFLCQVFSIFIGYVMLLGAVESGQEMLPSFYVAGIGLLYINIVVYLTVERVKTINEIKRQNELAEQLYTSKLEYFNQVKNDQEQTRSLWHDIQKYMNTMQELIRLGDLANARDCIGHVSELFERTGAVVDVGNTVVSAVLNHSVQRARRKNISIDMDVRVSEELNISAADLSVIIGNTFENAIEAVSMLEGDMRRISVQLIQKDNIVFYEILNPFVNPDKPQKKDKAVHGYGLKNVQRCVSKYKGNMAVDMSEGWCRLSVLIAVA